MAALEPPIAVFLIKRTRLLHPMGTEPMELFGGAFVRGKGGKRPMAKIGSFWICQHHWRKAKTIIVVKIIHSFFINYLMLLQKLCTTGRQIQKRQREIRKTKYTKQYQKGENRIKNKIKHLSNHPT